MKLQYVALTTLLVVSCLVIGCTDETAPTTEDVGPLSERGLALATHSSIPEGQLAEGDPEQHAVATIEASMTLRNVVRQAADWREADRRVRAYLSDNTAEAPLYSREQLAATAMLQTWLLDGEPTRSERVATGFYTEMLIKNGNRQAAVILAALRQLDGYWSADRIRQAAASTAKRAQGVTCGDCAASKLSSFRSALSTAEHTNRNHMKRDEAVRALQVMSTE